MGLRGAIGGREVMTKLATERGASKGRGLGMDGKGV